MPPAQTAEQRSKALVDAGLDAKQMTAVLTGTPYTTPSSAPPVIATDALGNPTQPYKMPDASPVTTPDYYKSLISSIPTAADITAGAKSADQIAAESARGTISSRMLTALDKSLGKSEATRAAEERYGIPDLNKQLTDVTSQITALKNEAAAIPLVIQEESEGRGRTVGGVEPLQAGRLRQNAIKSLSLSSIASALQGNLALARQEADRAIAAEFDPVERELSYLEAMYKLNADDLSRADKAQATRIEGALQDRRDKLDQAKTDRAALLKMVGDAVAVGAPASIATQALGVSLGEATALLAPYTKNDWSEPYLLGGDYVQKNNRTGEIRTAVNVNAGGSGGGAGTFTTTQLNSGAANAGLPISEFTALDSDTKNYFINAYGSSELRKDIQAVNGGGLTSDGLNKQEVIAGVRSSNLPDGVKGIILRSMGVNIADAATQQAQANAGGGGFWSGVGSAIGNAVGGWFR